MPMLGVIWLTHSVCPLCTSAHDACSLSLSEDHTVDSSDLSVTGHSQEETDSAVFREDNGAANERETKRKKGLARKLRPISQPTFDVDRLLRIKSDIRLNLAKQVH